VSAGAADQLLVLGTFRLESELPGVGFVEAGYSGTMYLVRYDAAGVLLSGRLLGATGTESPGGAAPGADGSVTMAGDFQCTANLNGAYYANRYCPTGTDVFLLNLIP
jgi:hypothetical protein